MARLLIDWLDGPFEPEEFTDEYRGRVMALIEEKAAGANSAVQTIPAAAESEGVVDLMEALEASVAAANEARTRHPAANTAAKSKRKGHQATTSSKKPA